MSGNNLDFIANEISLVESRNIDYFKSQPSVSEGELHLRLKDCIWFQLIDLPPKSQRVPAVLYRNYQLGDKIILPDAIIKELMDEINKKFTQ